MKHPSRLGRFFVLASLVFVAAMAYFRFYRIDASPPGFYADEAAIATQVLCIQETGSDLFLNEYPLFSPVLGGGFATAPYLYSQMAWTSVFGPSVAAFRSWMAMVTLLMIAFLGLWIRRSVGLGPAIWFLILASISPWGFQFSRVAWDPPMAPLFIALAIWAFTAARSWSPWLGGFFFAVAAYSYPPVRVQSVLFLLMMPGVSWRDTFKALSVFVVTLIPLFLRALQPDFNQRAQMVGIWSDYSGNPYRGESLGGLAWGVVKNTLLHFTPDFLLLQGDRNVRHSTQSFGMISWVEAFGLAVGAIGLFFSRVRSRLTPSELSLIWVGLVGILTGILPAAMTWESVPHALRSITAWPFFCVLAALALSKFLRGRWQWLGLVAAIAFAYFYLDDYFNVYPDRARPWFQTDGQRMAEMYHQMAAGGHCEKGAGLPLR